MSVGVVKSYYASVSGYMDELLWAATWLYKATDKEEYLDYVINNANHFGGIGWSITEFSWDVKYAGLQLIASQVNFLNLVSILSKVFKKWFDTILKSLTSLMQL